MTWIISNVFKMQFVRFQPSHHFLTHKIWLIINLSTKSKRWSEIHMKIQSYLRISFHCLIVTFTAFLFWSKSRLKSLLTSQTTNFLFPKRVDFFCFFGEILIYDFAPAGNVLNLIFRTYKKSSFTISQFCQISRKM